MLEGFFVVLGLAPPRSGWFRSLAQWSTSGSVPVEFVKCVSVDEMRVRLEGSRAFSAALVDGDLSGLDRDLVDLALSSGCPVIVVGDRAEGRDWSGLGAAAELRRSFDREQLLAALRAHGRALSTPDLGPHRQEPPAPAMGTTVALCGPGGTGTSTLAIALAQSMADNGRVVLADLARRAQQAALHDAGDLSPSVVELTDAYRAGRPGPDEVRGLTYRVEERGYHILLGLRRPVAWSALRPRAFAAAFAGLRSAFDTVVVDTDADVEGERDSGSIEVEERNVMSRTALSAADVVVIVGRPGLKGLHSLVSVLSDMASLGVEPSRVLPVLSCAPRSPRARAELARSFGKLVLAIDRSPAPQVAGWRTGKLPVAAPLFVPERSVEAPLRDCARLPEGLGRPLASAVRAVLSRAVERPQQARDVPIAPGTLGHWAGDGGPGDGSDPLAALG
ncbi:MAG: hypothetical protein ACRDYD_04475 [Acidimicrobiales bacterium]